MASEYTIAQYCLKGHLIVADIWENPNLMCRHCPECGLDTIAQCPSCHAPIYVGKRTTSYNDWLGLENEFYKTIPRPSCCHECGKPYPWTLTAIADLEKELSDINDLSEDDRNTIISSCPDAVSETSLTPKSAEVFKKVLKNADPILKEILVRFVSGFGSSLLLKLLGL